MSGLTTVRMCNSVEPLTLARLPAHVDEKGRRRREGRGRILAQVVGHEVAAGVAGDAVTVAHGVWGAEQLTECQQA